MESGIKWQVCNTSTTQHDFTALTYGETSFGKILKAREDSSFIDGEDQVIQICEQEEFKNPTNENENESNLSKSSSALLPRKKSTDSSKRVQINLSQ